MTTAELDRHIKQLHLCELTGAKPRTYRALLEEIVHQRTNLGRLAAAVNDLHGEIRVDEFQNLREETKDICAEIHEALDHAKTEAYTVPERPV